MAFDSEHVPPMRAEEFNSARTRLDLTQEQMARLLGKTPRQISRFEEAKLHVPQDTAMLIRILVRHKKLRYIVDKHRN